MREAMREAMCEARQSDDDDDDDVVPLLSRCCPAVVRGVPLLSRCCPAVVNPFLNPFVFPLQILCESFCFLVNPFVNPSWSLSPPHNLLITRRVVLSVYVLIWGPGGLPIILIFESLYVLMFP